MLELYLHEYKFRFSFFFNILLFFNTFDILFLVIQIQNAVLKVNKEKLIDE